MQSIVISIISPVYKAENIVDELVKRIVEEVQLITLDYEIILVEDGSADGSWNKIVENAKNNPKVKGIKLSRNFGQHQAITAGIKASKGNYVVVMDCDLQDNPKYIAPLLEEAEKGFDIVFTIKKERKFSWYKNLTARLFYRIFNYLVDNQSFNGSDKIGSYSLLTRKAVTAFMSFGDYRRHYLMVLRWLGLENSFIVINHDERYAGKSSYNFSRLITHALDGIVNNSDKILRMTATFGFILFIFSFLAAFGIFIAYFIEPFQAGWASLAVLILISSGLIILSVGVCGIYIGRIFEQTKNRPIYIVDKSINL
jgi:polyisoprenyl-phosphate glycosyltransferase